MQRGAACSMILPRAGRSLPRGAWIQPRPSFEDTLMLGLQFLMAADVIGTISGSIVLSVIVLLRLILSFTLSCEGAEMDRHKRESAAAQRENS